MSELTKEIIKLRKLLKKQVNPKTQQRADNSSRVSEMIVTDTLKPAASDMFDGNDVQLNSSNVLLISTYISLCSQILTLEKQRDCLKPFVPTEIVESLAKFAAKSQRKNKNSSNRKGKVTAYMLFFREKKADDPGLTMQVAGSLWRQLTQEEKQAFQLLADKENEEKNLTHESEKSTETSNTEHIIDLSLDNPVTLNFKSNDLLNSRDSDSEVMEMMGEPMVFKDSKSKKESKEYKLLKELSKLNKDSIKPFKEHKVSKSGKYSARESINMMKDS